MVEVDAIVDNTEKSSMQQWHHVWQSVHLTCNTETAVDGLHLLQAGLRLTVYADCKEYDQLN